MMDDLDRKIYSTATKVDDIEIRVSLVNTSHGSYADIREYVLSTDQWGRGLTFPVTKELIQSLQSGLAKFTFTD